MFIDMIFPNSARYFHDLVWVYLPFNVILECMETRAITKRDHTPQTAPCHKTD